MYSSHKQIHQLTALLIAHDIRHIVVCPGSRNAALIHDFHTTKQFQLYPITDERSAAFVALGIIDAIDAPCAICVTSGTAVLNTLPAVAEARLRHRPLLVISADRPAEWIGQQDGQTLTQINALSPYAEKSITLTLAQNRDEEWHNNRLLNEALLALHESAGSPAHINVPVKEPLFAFTVENLPVERVIRPVSKTTSMQTPPEVIDLWERAKFPVLIIGQLPPQEARIIRLIRALDGSGRLLILPEFISNLPFHERLLSLEETCAEERLQDADFILHIGGNTVGKAVKQLLRRKQVAVVRVGEDANVVDTFQHLVYVWRTTPVEALLALSRTVKLISFKVNFRQYFPSYSRPNPPSSDAIAHCTMRLFREQLSQLNSPAALHLANSTAVRLAAKYLYDTAVPRFCNRGTNRIEGSLSTAVGYSLASSARTFCLIGDLSFFYDSNALWNAKLLGNLRILLFNSGGGKLFASLPHLSESEAFDDYISGRHNTSAEGIARAYQLRYFRAETTDELCDCLPEFVSEDAPRPVLLEVFV